jgi:FG-GAP repeat
MMRFKKQFDRVFATACVGGVLSLVSPAVGQVAHESMKIVPSDGQWSDWFGYSVAMENGVIAVGSINDDDNGLTNGPGSVYLYDAQTGALITKLLADDATTDRDQFGRVLDIDNGILAVGANADTDNGTQSGSAYLFDLATGTQLFKLLPDDGDDRDQFGTQIAIDNGIVVVGAWLDEANGASSGSAYLFDATTGQQITKLLPPDVGQSDFFGAAVAIGDGVVAVGAFGDTDNGPATGSVYLFDATTGTQLDKILPSDAQMADSFGVAVSIDNGILAVGAYNVDDVAPNAGAVYLFDLATREELMKLTASDGADGDELGFPLAMDNGILVAGAFLSDPGGINQAGAVYLFDVETGEEMVKLLPTNGDEMDRFGHSFAIENGMVVVGSYEDDDIAFNGGAVYIFECHADFTGDLMVDVFDVFAFLDFFGAQNPIADLTGDGNFNFLDVSAFLVAFNAGCP